MKLSELVDHVGDNNIQLQWLHESIVAGDTNRNGSTVTFATDGGKVIGFTEGADSEYVGAVVWFPRERMPEHMR